MAGLLTLPIHDVRIETPRTRVVRLSLGREAFDFCAGQSVNAGVHGQPLRKPYSIACSPGQARRDNLLELLIQVAEDGSAGSHLGAPVPGMLLDLEGPFGTFCFPNEPAERHFFFVAGGTGIAPLRSMIGHALERLPDRQVSLLYSARSEDEFAYGAEFQSLARRRRIRLRETVTRGMASAWAGDRGRVTRPQVAAMLLTPLTRCFVCGPPAFVQDVTTWLSELGVAPARIMTEGW